jgi:arsenical pump membrane protein
VLAAARRTVGPFFTLTVVLLAASLAWRVGLFRRLERLVPERHGSLAAAAGVLALTAVLSAGANLDVAVVVAIPLALRVAAVHALDPGWTCAAVACTANATSFLLPTSNVTTLLVLHRAPLGTTAFLAHSWLPWVLVTATTATILSLVLARLGPPARVRSPVGGGPRAGAVGDLIPMFLTATAIRALLGVGLRLAGPFAAQVVTASMLAAGANNLPAAAAVHATSPAGAWAAVLGTAIGPNLVLTGSVATVISRRIARDGGVRMSAGRFSLLGAAMVPVQLALAALGLGLAGVLH